jgi:AcrR family transcriptional regulator
MNASNHSLDLRVRRTNKFLWEALMSLLEENDFESITVTAICERAMVHRTTFYTHYEDKYALLFQGIQDELNALFEKLDSAAAKPLGMDEEPDMLTHFVILLEHVLKHERFYGLMLVGDEFGKFSTLLRKSLVERFERHPRWEGNQNSMPVGLHAQLHAAAMVTTIAWWLENDHLYTPVEMATFLQHHLAMRAKL